MKLSKQVKEVIYFKIVNTLNIKKQDSLQKNCK